MKLAKKKNWSHFKLILWPPANNKQKFRMVWVLLEHDWTVCWIRILTWMSSLHDLNTKMKEQSEYPCAKPVVLSLNVVLRWLACLTHICWMTMWMAQEGEALMWHYVRRHCTLPPVTGSLILVLSASLCCKGWRGGGGGVGWRRAVTGSLCAKGLNNSGWLVRSADTNISDRFSSHDCWRYVCMRGG